jgi:hypothetical protein
MAVFTLPDDELFHFYKFHIDFITDHAVDPDKRRYAVEGEAEKHYIDIDYYANNGENPFTKVPKKSGPLWVNSPAIDWTLIESCSCESSVFNIPVIPHIFKILI